MGWDTQINMLVENIKDQETAIAQEIFETDAKNYFHNGISFVKYRICEDGSKVLFLTYERRKYLPHWTIQEVSQKFKDQYFTVIGSCPDFIGGPAGLVKIQNGIILDSYGIVDRFGDHLSTIQRLENPDPEVLFRCFGKNRLEETIRELYLEGFPKQWIDEAYANNMLEFKPEEMEQFRHLTERLENTGSWIEINPNFNP